VHRGIEGGIAYEGARADKYPPPQSKSERIWCLTNDRNRANMELSGNVPGKLPGNILERLT
jgi:hypothetical protein